MAVTRLLLDGNDVATKIMPARKMKNPEFPIVLKNHRR